MLFFLKKNLVSTGQTTISKHDGYLWRVIPLTNLPKIKNPTPKNPSLASTVLLQILHLFQFTSMALTQHVLKPTINPPLYSFHRSLLTSKAPLSVQTHMNSLFSTPRGHFLQNRAPTFTRRLFIPSVSGIWDALTGGNNNSREAVVAIRRGMLLFRQVNFVSIRVCYLQCV